jgi:hypothetical protein
MDLPRQARAYLERIESLVETPVRHVSVGTRRDQILECSDDGWGLSEANRRSRSAGNVAG